MMGEVVKRSGRKRFYLLCNYSCTLYLLVDILLVKSQIIHSSARENLNPQISWDL